ncbi:Vacuolar protein sorting-associated protein 35, partial [Blyttiomyces sp. JEL0837]
MAIFDELRHLTTFLYEAHMSGRHHLSDLYELVQYAGNILPRLYLMITVGSVYLRVSRESRDALKEQQAKAPPSNASTFENNPPLDGSESGEGNSMKEFGSSVGESTTRTTTVNGESSGQPDEDAPPVKELMKDMLEMSRGVQHPTRGLFLRYYLSGMTRDYLPDGVIDGPHGTIDDSIRFILQNFIEMNKLWVRLQHLGHSREREKREIERKELRLLVGSNLVRLSQLDGLNLDIFKSTVLPSVLGEIVSCKDVIAQEYLMEVIIQVFPDDFHLHTLDSFLQATAQLSRFVNVKQTVISLIDRFAAFASRARDEAESRAKEAAANGIVLPNSGIPEDVELFEVFWEQITGLVKARPEFTVQDVVALLVSLINLSLNCYPDRLDHVDKVLGFAKERVLEAMTQKAPELYTPQTTSSLLQLLLAPVQAYKYNPLTYLLFPSSSVQQPSEDDQNVHPAARYGAVPPSPRGPVSLGGHFTDLLFLQPFSTRRQVAHAIAQQCLRASMLVPPPALGGLPMAPVSSRVPFRIDSVEGVDVLFGELCSVMVRDQNDGGLFGPRASARELEGELRSRGEDIPLDWEDVVEEQNMVAKLVHLVVSSEEDPDKEFQLLSAARKHFGEGGEIRIRFTLPPLVIACVQLGRKFYSHPTLDDSAISTRLTTLYKFIHQTVLSLSRAREYFSDDDYSGPLFKDDPVSVGSSSAATSKIGRGLLSPPDMALRLFLMAAKCADQTGHEELSYEFFVQALTIYEEAISESRAQTAAITIIIGTLYTTTVFGFENYETLITKCAVHCSRLMKRVDQCRGVALVSHLFWAGVNEAKGDVGSGAGSSKTTTADGKVVYRDGKRVLECLQKALKISDSVMDQAVNIELFVEILERYIWYYENRNDAIAVKYLNSLIDLIQTNLANMDASAGVPPSTTSHQTAGPLSGSTHSLF